METMICFFLKKTVRLKAMILNEFLYKRLLARLPKNRMSHYLGVLAHFKGSDSFNRKIIKKFASHYRIDLNEIEKPIEEYKSLGDFFSRRLKPGARPVKGPLIHPCDGTLIESGKIYDQVLIQAKGKSYKLSELTPDNPWMENFRKGSFFTYYLAPHNYHRVHSPVDCKVKWSVLIPGELWPVNSWSVKNIKNLYCINERVVTGLEYDRGQMILVLVGATNVGSISLDFDPDIKTNSQRKRQRIFRHYPETRNLKVGDNFGAFRLGSTVIMLFDNHWDFSYKQRQEVKIGEKF